MDVPAPKLHSAKSTYTIEHGGEGKGGERCRDDKIGSQFCSQGKRTDACVLS